MNGKMQSNDHIRLTIVSWSPKCEDAVCGVDARGVSWENAARQIATHIINGFSMLHSQKKFCRNEQHFSKSAAAKRINEKKVEDGVELVVEGDFEKRNCKHENENGAQQRCQATCYNKHDVICVGEWEPNQQRNDYADGGRQDAEKFHGDGCC
jgi:hypothetical protein